MNFSKLTKKFSVGVLVATCVVALTACGGNKPAENSANGTETKNSAEANGNNAATASAVEGAINVITREDGSGTRGAFTEIVGLVEKDASGNETDTTSTEAAVQNSTDAVMTATANDEASVGYISLGSLNDTVKAVTIEGVEATPENITNGTYKIARPFNIVYKDGVTPGVQDFLTFIASEEGQKIAEEEGYVPNKDVKPYSATDNSESITIAGSTSVTPLMEKLVEAYKAHNPNFNADIQATGSSAGIQSAIDGTAQLGMASRELKDEEKSQLKVEVIAMDGIAVIVNKANAVADLTIDQVKNIFNGTTKDWAEVNAK